MMRLYLIAIDSPEALRVPFDNLAVVATGSFEVHPMGAVRGWNADDWRGRLDDLETVAQTAPAPREPRPPRPEVAPDLDHGFFQPGPDDEKLPW